MNDPTSDEGAPVSSSEPPPRVAGGDAGGDAERIDGAGPRYGAVYESSTRGPHPRPGADRRVRNRRILLLGGLAGAVVLGGLYVRGLRVEGARLVRKIVADSHANSARLAVLQIMNGAGSDVPGTETMAWPLPADEVAPVKAVFARQGEIQARLQAARSEGFVTLTLRDRIGSAAERARATAALARTRGAMARYFADSHGSLDAMARIGGFSAQAEEIARQHAELETGERATTRRLDAAERLIAAAGRAGLSGAPGGRLRILVPREGEALRTAADAYRARNDEADATFEANRQRHKRVLAETYEWLRSAPQRDKSLPRP